MATAAQRQFLIKVRGVEDLFAVKTGGDTASDVAVAWDGGSLTPEKLAGPALTEDITVSRPFKSQRDSQIARRLRKVVGRWRTSISVQPTDADLVPVGKPTVYTRCVLTRLVEPAADAASGEPSRLELTFSPEDVE